MSFSFDVKNELCKRASAEADCCSRSLLFGILLFANRFASDSIRLVTENPAIIRLYGELMMSIAKVNAGGGFGYGKFGKTAVSVNDRSDVRKVFDKFGLETVSALHINLSVMECDKCTSAFVRGAFLSGGSVTDPRKRYHFELSTTHYYVSREIVPLLRDVNVNIKSVCRKSNYILYLKRSEEIEDILTLMGAPLAAMEIMNAKLEKELRGNVSRRVNCDSANAGKIAGAAASQLVKIRQLEADGIIRSLPEPLQEAAALRVSHPEASLSELSAISGLSKSGLVHRFKRIANIDSS